MGKLGKQRKENRVERIRAAALKLFEEYGYQTTTMEQIAERADFSVRTLYNYFESKADILVDFMSDHKIQYAKLGKELLDKDQGSPAQILSKLFRLYYNEVTMNKDLMLEMLSAMLSPHSKVREKLSPTHNQITDINELLLKKFIKEGKLSPKINVPKAAELLLYVGIGLDMSYRICEINDLKSLEKKAEFAIDTILKGLQST